MRRNLNVRWLLAIAILPLALASVSFAQNVTAPAVDGVALTLSLNTRSAEIGETLAVRAHVNRYIPGPVTVVAEVMYQNGNHSEMVPQIVTTVCDNGLCQNGLDYGQEFIAYQQAVTPDTKQGSYQVSVSTYDMSNPKISRVTAQAGWLWYDLGNASVPYGDTPGAIINITTLGLEPFGGTVVKLEGNFTLSPEFQVIVRNSDGATKLLTVQSDGHTGTFVIPKDNVQPGVPMDVTAVFPAWLIESCAPRSVVPPRR